jgi:serine/threonine protein kinase
LKLIDFGFSDDVLPGADSMHRKYLGGTKNYLSPESLAHYSVEDGVMKKKEGTMIVVGFKSDIWALGIILYQGTCHLLIHYNIIRGRLHDRFSIRARSASWTRPAARHPPVPACTGRRAK